MSLRSLRIESPSFWNNGVAGMMPRSASEGADDDFIAKGRTTPRVVLVSVCWFRRATPFTHNPLLLGSDSRLPNHAHLVMQGADVREEPGVRESDAETCHAKGRLWQPAPFLWRRDDEPRMGAVGSGSDDGVPGPILIDRYVGGRFLNGSRLLPVGKGMQDDLSPVIPIDRLFRHELAI